MGFSIDQIQYFDFDTHTSNILLEKTIVCIVGGNPFYLLQSLRMTDGQKVLHDLFEKKAYLFGISAGSIIMGPSLALVNSFTPYLNSYGLTDLTTLHFTKDFIFPHYDRSDLFGLPIEEKIVRFESISGEKVKRIRDDACIFYP